MEVARHLQATEFQGYGHGSSGKKSIDCVQFIAAVAEAQTKNTFDDETRNGILINHGWSHEESTTKIPESGTDPKLAGIQYALTTLTPLGRKIPPNEAKAGDYIQYWMKRKNGKWFGHAGIIETIDEEGAKIFGSHKSSNGIATSNFKLNLLGEDRLIYILRIE